MNDKVENLILEHLRVMRSDMSAINEEIRGIRSEMRSMKQHMAAFMGHESTQDGDIASMKLQLERIGKRLDIVETERPLSLASLNIDLENRHA